MAVAGPLLSFLRSATVLRKDSESSRGGSTSLSVHLPSSSSASSGVPAAGWHLDWADDFVGGSGEQKWSIRSESAEDGGGLLDFHQRGSAYHMYDCEWDVDGLAEALRKCGILAGSSRQQSVLLAVCAQALFDVAFDRGGLDWDEAQEEACNGACGYVRPPYDAVDEAASDEAQEPPLSPDELAAAAEEERARAAKRAAYSCRATLSLPSAVSAQPAIAKIEAEDNEEEEEEEAEEASSAAAAEADDGEGEGEYAQEEFAPEGAQSSSDEEEQKKRKSEKKSTAAAAAASSSRKRKRKQRDEKQKEEEA